MEIHSSLSFAHYEGNTTRNGIGFCSWIFSHFEFFNRYQLYFDQGMRNTPEMSVNAFFRFHRDFITREWRNINTFFAATLSMGLAHRHFGFFSMTCHSPLTPSLDRDNNKKCQRRSQSTSFATPRLTFMVLAPSQKIGQRVAIKKS